MKLVGISVKQTPNLFDSKPDISVLSNAHFNKNSTYIKFYATVKVSSNLYKPPQKHHFIFDKGSPRTPNCFLQPLIALPLSQDVPQSIQQRHTNYVVAILVSDWPTLVRPVMQRVVSISATILACLITYIVHNMYGWCQRRPVFYETVLITKIYD